MTDAPPSNADPPESGEPKLLGPFLGYVTPTSVKIWLYREEANAPVYVTVHPRPAPGQPVSRESVLAAGTLNFDKDKLFAACTTVEGLAPDTEYAYRLWTTPTYSQAVFLDGLSESDLHFRTLPERSDEQIDFLLMSCHNPFESGADDYDGHAVWADIPEIVSREHNRNLRFAILGGDQVYADDWKDQILEARSEEERVALYLTAYKKFWKSLHYRRVLCRLPAVLIWDDHDIVNSWGSEESSFVGQTTDFKSEWQGLYGAAAKAFMFMQASRNPPLLSPDMGFDCCFRIGKWGFVLLDLRSNRNVRKKQIMDEEQAYRIQRWLEDNKKDMHAVFIVSPVVFTHSAPFLDDLTISVWPTVMSVVDACARLTDWGKGMQTRFKKTLGDIRGDIKDSWAAAVNADQTDMILGFLFDLQNDSQNPTRVIILSGDIHTSGYATVYSSDERHKEASSIPHITSSSVAYAPFNWLLEAVYRKAAKTVQLGKKGKYSSQVSHHYCARSLCVLSIRPKVQKRNGEEAQDFQLKVKYYLEGYPEPQIMVFDLDRTSHRENIAWVAPAKLFSKDYSPPPKIDFERKIEQSAKASGSELNWRESVVDLMKALGIDSSLGTRKRLAKEWGYTETLGTRDMNIWLHRELMRRYEAAGGTVPPEMKASAP